MNYKSYILGAVALLGFTACNDDNDTAGPLEVDMKCDRTEILAGDKVCFMDQSTGNPARWDWTFEGGEPATSQLFSPEVVYNTPGTYSVTLKVGRGEESAEKTFSQLINVAYPGEMTADFESNLTNAYNTDEVIFTDKSVGFPNQWEWIFETADGIRVTSDQQNPALKFAPGLYTVTLNVSSPAANATVTKADYLNVIDHDAVAAEFAAKTDRIILAGQSVAFEDLSMGRPEQWAWTFEGADTPSSSDRNPVVTYSTPGRYKVTLVTSNEVNSSTCEKADYVIVIPSAGLKMWFPLDGTLKDYSPAGNIVLNEYVSDPAKWAVDLTVPSRHEGRTAAKLGGVCKTNTDDYAVFQIGNPEQLPGGLQELSFVMWVKSDGADGSRQSLYNRGRPAGAITSDTADKNQSQEWARLNTTSAASEGFVRWYVNTTGQGSASAANATSRNYLDNQWHCIVFVKEIVNEKLVAKIYVDGELAASAAAQTPKDTYKDPFFIGCTEQFTKTKDHQINTPFMGSLDDLMMYDYAMDATQVAQLYNIMK